MPSAIQVPKRSARRSRPLTNMEKSAICRYQRRHPSASSAALVVWARDELGVTVSCRTVSQLLKKARVNGKADPLKVLYNILDDYTYGPNYHTEVKPKKIIEKKGPYIKPFTSEENNKNIDINSQTEISPGAVKKYLKGWIAYLTDSNHTEKDSLICIAEKHLQDLEKHIMNSMLQTTIHCYFKTNE